MVNNEPDDKWITIICENKPTGFITIRVRDRGVGINHEHADKLFQAFFSTKSHGMGMGLAISHSIITSHGGQMKVNQNYKDGAEITFTLPIMPVLGAQPHEH